VLFDALSDPVELLCIYVCIVLCLSECTEIVSEVVDGVGCCIRLNYLQRFAVLVYDYTYSLH